MNKDKNEEILEVLEDLNEYQIVYQFSDVVRTIKAESEEQAKIIADSDIEERLNNIRGDSECYDITIDRIYDG